MPIAPAQLARSLGALGPLDVEQGLAGTLAQVLGSAKTLLHADRVGLLLVDQSGALGWASASDGMAEARSGDLNVPVHVGGGPVGTLDVYLTAPRRWDDIEQAVKILVDREGLDAQAALAWLGAAARSSGYPLIQMARAVVGGAPLPSDLLAQARAERREATDLEVATHRRDSELHEGAARGYERRGQAGRAQTERLQAAAARGRIIDAEAERRRADAEP